MERLKPTYDELQARVAHLEAATETLATTDLLRKGEKQLWALIERSPIAMALVQMDGTIEYINGCAVRTFGYLHEDIPVMDRWWVQAYPDDSYRQEAQTKWTGLVEKAISSDQEIERAEYRVTCKDGTLKTMVIFGAIVEDKVFVMFEDITERKKTEEANEFKFKQLFDEMNDGLAVYEVIGDGKDFVFRDINASGERIGNVEKSKVIGRSLYEIRPNIDEFGLPETLRNVWRTGEVEHHAERFYQDEELQGWFDNWVYKLDDNHVVAMFADNTFRRKAERALRESEAKYRRVSDNSPAVLYQLRITPDGAMSFQYVSDVVTDLLGVNPEDIINDPSTFLRMVHPEDQEMFQEGVMKGIESLETFPLIFRCLKDGEDIWFEARGTPTALTDGDSLWDGFLLDITERRQAEERVRESKEYLDDIINNIGDPVFVKDDQSVLLLVNDAFCKLFGLPRGDVLGKTLAEDVPPDERESFFRIDKQVLTTGQGNIREESLTVRDEPTKTIVTRKSCFVDKEGKKQLVGVIRDITDVKQLQAQIAQSDRLASMGMLAAGVAHEINNPLSYVLYNLESLTEDVPELLSAVRQVRARMSNSIEAPATSGDSSQANRLMNPTALDDMLSRFDDALSGARRIQDVVRGLGTFSRVERDQLAPVDLTHGIEAALTMAANEIKYRARLVKDFGKVPTVLASEGRLSQVFLNLIINATHAIEEGDLENNKIHVRTWLEGDEVCAEVRDTGSGIVPENLSKLFEPFFSTKKIGGGSGLGLAISKNIIESYHGTITVQSEVGKGTSFTIRLPVETAAMESIAAAVPSMEPKNHGRILIVDDEKGIRSAMVRMLKGHETVQADCGAEAKRILENDQEFDLVLCDMMMPDVSGMDLHMWLSDAHPGLAAQLVFITGGAFTPRAREYLNEVENIRLEKPFDVANFKKIVSDRIYMAKSGKST